MHEGLAASAAARHGFVLKSLVILDSGIALYIGGAWIQSIQNNNNKAEEDMGLLLQQTSKKEKYRVDHTLGMSHFTSENNIETEKRVEKKSPFAFCVENKM